MKKKTLLALISLLLVVAMLAGCGSSGGTETTDGSATNSGTSTDSTEPDVTVDIQGEGTTDGEGNTETESEWHPSSVMTDASISENEVTTSGGATIYVTVDPLTSEDGEIVDHAEYGEPWIKVTPVADTIDANETIDEENADLTEEERHPLLTETTLLYSVNARVNELFQQLMLSSSTEAFLNEAAAEIIDEIEEAADGDINAYTPLALYDISASANAIEVIGEDTVAISIEMAGVTEDSDLIAIRFARDPDDEEDSACLLEIIPGDEIVTLVFDAESFGPVMILIRA